MASVFGRRLERYELLIFAVLFVLIAITLAASVVLAEPPTPGDPPILTDATITG